MVQLIFFFLSVHQIVEIFSFLSFPFFPLYDTDCMWKLSKPAKWRTSKILEKLSYSTESEKKERAFFQAERNLRISEKEKIQ